MSYNYYLGSNQNSFIDDSQSWKISQDHLFFLLELVSFKVSRSKQIPQHFQLIEKFRSIAIALSWRSRGGLERQNKYSKPSMTLGHN